MSISKYVTKNHNNWKHTDFDLWGRGLGYGEIVEVLDENSIDVRWVLGRSYERVQDVFFHDSIPPDVNQNFDIKKVTLAKRIFRRNPKRFDFTIDKLDLDYNYTLIILSKIRKNRS